MKVEQTSAIVFITKIINSVIGFLATVYFARLLGAEVIGLYSLIMTIVFWFGIAGEFGIGKALIKKVSENKESGAYLFAAIIWTAFFGLFVCILILITEPLSTDYVSKFSDYSTVSVVWFIIILLVTRLFNRFATKLLKGEKKVHLAGLLSTIGQFLSRSAQIVFVILNFGLVGILIGNTVGLFLAGVIGLYWVTTRPVVPERRHFRSLFEYAKFSWLGSLKSRTFSDVDILLLGVFVQPSLVGVYAVAWSIAKFLNLFGSSISTTLFPEVSQVSAEESNQAAAGLIENSIAYTGLIAIPGFIGGTILAEQLLRIYGPEFTRGATVLSLLLLAVLLRSYQMQLINAFNGLDRPDIAFRINAVFIVLNAGLNVILIWQFGIEGAAIASAVSVTLSLVLAYRSLHGVVDFPTPVGEVSRQIVAGVVMGGSVWAGLFINQAVGILQRNVLIVFIAVLLGGIVYMTVLVSISQRFRAVIYQNMPGNLLSTS